MQRRKWPRLDIPVMFERRRSIAQTFSAGLRREDMGLSGSKKMT
jgi:hypothetical protein